MQPNMDILPKLLEIKTCIVENVEEVCRICFSIGELEPLTDSSVQSTYRLLLHFLNFTNDGEVPNKICKNCMSELKNIASFISKLEKSTNILRKMLKKGESMDPASYNKKSHCETIVEYLNQTTESLNINDEDIPGLDIQCGNCEYIEHPIEQVKKEINRGVSHEVSLPEVMSYCTSGEEQLEKMIDNVKRSNIKPSPSCQICGRIFPDIRAFHLHTSHHTRNDSDTEEVIHLEVEKKPGVTKPYVCNICTKGFVYEMSWKYHMTSHSQKKLCECTYCDWTGMNEIEHNDHVKKNHSHEVGISGKEDGNQEYVCLVCGKCFMDVEALLQHSDSHSKHFECELCGLTFKMKSTLLKHQLHHNDEGIYECTQCDKVLTKKISLKRHMNIVHGDGQMKKGSHFMKNHVEHDELHEQKTQAISQEPGEFPCEYCGKKFTYRANLLRHIRITHAGMKKFSCTLCEEKFTVKNSLIYHMNIHNNAKPYQCEICSRAFRQPSALIRHKRQVHQTSEKRFKCEICDKLLKSNISLKAHMKRHEELNIYST